MSNDASGAELPSLLQESRPFEEPWQAQVMALAAHLVEAGHFSAREWSNALGARIAEAATHGEPDTPATYFCCALSALEHLTQQKGLASAESLHAHKQAWIEAYEHTPHGQPVELKIPASP